jgi:hypothetical protein
MAELHAQIAELTAEKAGYAAEQAARVARHDDICRTACLTSQHATYLCYDAVHISVCHSARQLSCQLALLGLAERAQHACATQP